MSGDRNVVFIDDEGSRHQAVITDRMPDGSVTLTYQSGGAIHIANAVPKGGTKSDSGTYKAAKEEV